MSLTNGSHLNNCSDRPGPRRTGLGVVAGVRALVEVVDHVQPQRAAPVRREPPSVLAQETERPVTRSLQGTVLH